MRTVNTFYKTIPVLGLVMACGTEPVEPVAQELPVLRPTQVQTLSLEHTMTPDTSTLNASGLLAIGRFGALTIVGGNSGLYEITSTGLKQVDTQAVTAIASYGSTGLVVANAEGLFVFSGTLQQSPVTEVLGGAKITALAVRDEQLWIGTDLGLYVYENQTLHSFDETMNVVSLQSFTSGKDMVVQTKQGFEIYRLVNDAWTRLTVAEDVNFTNVAPGTSSRIIGVSAGTLLQRVELENNKAAWRALATNTDENDPGARGVEGIVTDPTTGAVWVIEAATLTRIDPSEGSVSRMPRPTSLVSIQSTAVSSDGALWIYDGTQLHELGQTGGIVTYETIKALSAASCNDCHKSLGTAPMALDNYEQWVIYVDKIIERLDNDSMPPPGTALVGGTADTVRQWKALGMPQ